MAVAVVVVVIELSAEPWVRLGGAGLMLLVPAAAVGGVLDC